MIDSKRTPPKGRRKPVVCLEAPCLQANSVYALSSFKKILGVGDTFLRSAKRRGLRIRSVFGRSFLVGSDFMSWLDSQTRENGRSAD